MKQVVQAYLASVSFADAMVGHVLDALDKSGRLGLALGAQPQTFTGLAGFGDLFTTCVSPHGRNRGVGERIGKGESVDDILASMTSVAEGVPTTRAVLEQAQAIGVEMPIAEALNGILFNGLDPHEAITSLMTRATRPE